MILFTTYFDYTEKKSRDDIENIFKKKIFFEKYFHQQKQYGYCLKK